jgi:hypothetical protein
MRLMSAQDAGPAGHYYLGHSDRRISHVPALTVYIAPFRHTLIFRVRKAVTLLRIQGDSADKKLPISYLGKR